MNPARGVKFPQKALKEAPAIIAGGRVREVVRGRSRNRTHHGESHRGHRVANRRATGAAVAGIGSQVGTLPVRESVSRKISAPKTLKASGPFRSARTRSRRSGASATRGRGAPDEVVFGNRKGAPMRESKM